MNRISVDIVDKKVKPSTKMSKAFYIIYSTGFSLV